MDITVKQLLNAKEGMEKDMAEYINARKSEFEVLTGLKVQGVAVSKLTFSKWPDYQVSTLVDVYDQPKE